MSQWGTVIDALESLTRSALGDLPTGESGWERGIRPGQDQLTGRMPHVFAHDPTEQRTELDVGLQQEVRFQVQLDLWTRDETQEQVAARLDLIEAAIRANPTLSGAVDFAFCSARSVVEAAIGQKKERAGVILVQTRKVVR